MPKTKPPYPAEFRQQMVELVRAGRTPAELSREFGCTRADHHQLGGAGRRSTRASRCPARMA